MKKYERIEKITNRYDKENFMFYEFVNGHDITAVIKGLGHTDSKNNIERRLLNDLSSESLLDMKFFVELKDWAERNNILLF